MNTMIILMLISLVCLLVGFAWWLVALVTGKRKRIPSYVILGCAGAFIASFTVGVAMYVAKMPEPVAPATMAASVPILTPTLRPTVTPSPTRAVAVQSNPQRIISRPEQGPLCAQADISFGWDDEVVQVINKSQNCAIDYILVRLNRDYNYPIGVLLGKEVRTVSVSFFTKVMEKGQPRLQSRLGVVASCEFETGSPKNDRQPCGKNIGILHPYPTPRSGVPYPTPVFPARAQ